MRTHACLIFLVYSFIPSCMEKMEGIPVENLKTTKSPTTNGNSGDLKNSPATPKVSDAEAEDPGAGADARAGASAPAASSSGHAIVSVDLPELSNNLRFFASGFKTLNSNDANSVNFGTDQTAVTTVYKSLIAQNKVTDCFQIFVDSDLEKTNNEQFIQKVDAEKKLIQENYSGYTVSYEKNLCPADGSKIVAVMEMKLPVIQNFSGMTRDQMLAASQNSQTYQSYSRKVSIFKNLTATERQSLKDKIAPAMVSMNLPIVKFFFSGDLKN
ncbi:MAG: hypothetical protein EBR09_11645 [Proteobacteria bacterium]|nr:hypothetical protein [Pseudomonadota bacterium]